ncbi:MAG TPA: hypothetical protein VMT52_01645 [Planctomycetota bacterium]|nr:hypothetical protein [Planctomycetota bacterium]
MWSVQAIVFLILALAVLMIVARLWLGRGQDEDHDAATDDVGGAEGEGKASGLGSRDDGGIGGTEDGE